MRIHRDTRKDVIERNGKIEALILVRVSKPKCVEQRFKGLHVGAEIIRIGLRGVVYHISPSKGCSLIIRASPLVEPLCLEHRLRHDAC